MSTTYHYSGTVVARARSGHVDAFSMSGIQSFEDLVRSLKDRARYSTLLAYTGACVAHSAEDEPGETFKVTTMLYSEAELRHLDKLRSPTRCPYVACGRELPRFPALSRQDNKTAICSECGTGEAFYNVAGGRFNGRFDAKVVLPRIERDPNYCPVCTPKNIGYCRCDPASNE